MKRKISTGGTAKGINMNKTDLEVCLGLTLARVHEIERILLRAGVHGYISSDTKDKLNKICEEIGERISSIPENV